MKPIRQRNPVLVGIVGLVVLAVIASGAFFWPRLPGVAGTTYTAYFTEAAGLKTGDEVRVAGVRVGEVTAVGLARVTGQDAKAGGDATGRDTEAGGDATGRDATAGGDAPGPDATAQRVVVRVRFQVKDAWVGDASTVAIKIRTLLGAKYLSVDPLGTGRQDPAEPIPTDRTASPFDVTQAFEQLSETVSAIDTEQLAASFRAVAETFRNTPPEVSAALDGLSRLSRTISSRDAQLARLVRSTRQVSDQLQAENSHLAALLRDGNLLLAEVQRRRDAISSLLTGTRQLAEQLTGLVADNRRQLAPALAQLDRVTEVLERNQANLNQALALAGPYYRLVGNTIGNGRWFDAYLCGLVPKNYLPEGTPPDTGCMPPRQGGGE
jgi:phospholipid/cholesterol/gamma-HCH transport system substrate-binding protein